MNKKELSKYMSKLGKKARKVHPYPKEHYQLMNKRSLESKNAKKTN